MADRRRVLVAGGGLGIGECVTDFLIHRHNARVVVFSLHVSDRIQKWASEGKLRVVQGDATSPEAICAASEGALEYMGGIDSLVITLGVIGEIKRVMDIDVEAMRRTFDINVFAPLQLTQHFLPHLRDSKGSLLILSSAADREICWSGWIPYSCSKAAITRFIEEVGHEEDDVKVLGIYPGLTRTPMVTDLLAGKYVGAMKDWEIEEFKRRDREGEVEPPEWSANTTAKLAAGAIPIPSQGKVLWYHALDPEFKDYEC